MLNAVPRNPHKECNKVAPLHPNCFHKDTHLEMELRWGYRQIGHGPGVLGGLKAGQHLIPLAEQLSEAITLYIPDRRGRGTSPYLGQTRLAKECEEIRALWRIPRRSVSSGTTSAGFALFAALNTKTLATWLYTNRLSQLPSARPSCGITILSWAEPFFGRRRPISGLIQ